MTAGTPKPQPDTSVPHSARVYDWLLGGKNNYLVDREMAGRLPPEARDGARLNRAFMHRAAAWLARGGTEQFLDVGTGIPTEPNLHRTVQRINPAARVVYVDNDPIVLRHAQALMVSAPQGATDYLDADIRDPAAILERAARLLDFTRPVALSLVAVLHFVRDEEDPYGIVRSFVEALAPGSHLVLSHGGSQHRDSGVPDRVAAAYEKGRIGLRLRSHEEVLRFFDGLDLVAPGLVTSTEWYQEPPAPEPSANGMHAGVARIGGAPHPG